MTKSDIQLEGIFPAQNELSWQQVLASSLKGVSIQNSLLRNTYEGFHLKGLYHKSNTPDAMKNTGYPGAYPFIRGDKAVGNVKNSWQVASSYYDKDPRIVNQQMKEDSLYGVNYLNLYMDRTGARGIRLNNIEDVEKLFKGIDIENKSIGFHFAEDIILSTNFLAHSFDVNKLDNKKISFHLNCDPYQILSKKGTLPFSIDRVMSHISEVIYFVMKEFPKSRSIGISTSCYHNAGSSCSQEIGYALNTMVENIEQFKKAGLKPKQILGQIVFSFSFDSQIFMNIAKMRAFRFLYAKVLESYDIDAREHLPKIFIRSSHRMMGLYDSWGNIMRTTTASFSAALSDVDIIDTFNFNKPLNDQFDLGDDYDKELPQRLSRNISHILRDESFLSKVVDPMGGSWFIESLTYELIKTAWKEFLTIEEKGGMGNAITSGFVKSQIENVVKQRQQRIHTRKEVVVGVTQFADTSEDLSSKWKTKEDDSYHISQKDCDATLMKDLVNATRNYEIFGKNKSALSEVLRTVYKKGLTLEKASQIVHSHINSITILPLKRFRSSEDFESLRLKYEKLEKKPEVNLIIMGDYAKLGARINFCKDIFELVGLQINEFIADANMESLPTNKENFNLYVLVSADVDVVKNIDSFLKLLHQYRGLSFVAGKLKDDIYELYQSKGIKNHLFRGQNILQVLEKIYTKLGNDK